MPVFTAMVVDNDFGDFQELRRSFIKLARTVTVDGVFNLSSAILIIEQIDESDLPPTLGVVILEATIDGTAPIELINRIRNCNKIKDIPIIIYTGNDNPENKNLCISAGASRVFKKGPKHLGANELVSFTATLMPL